MKEFKTLKTDDLEKPKEVKGKKMESLHKPTSDLGSLSV